MSITITRTKVILPRRRSDIISRERLLEVLDDVLDYRLTLVAAPAGYGKTSLLIDLAHRVEYPVCWFALDPTDQDFQRFIAHFIASIRHKFPAFGKNSQAVVQSMAPGPFDLKQLVAVIVNDVFENISEHFAVVLDDYHLIDDSEMINQFVSRFGQEMDENCHLIIASRTLLSLPDLPLMVGRSQVKGLSFTELAFRPDEIKTLLETNYDQSISDEKANMLAAETEGWITGLLLSAETMWHVMSDRVRVNRVAGVDLYDYLAQQVLDQQPPHIKEFLLQTSLLEEFNADLCQKVLGAPPGQEPWAALISYVLKKNLFTQPLEDDSTWLRYHHLFRDFLQARIARQDPEERNRILHNLSRVYAEQAEWEKAFSVCKKLRDQALTVEILKESTLQMMRTGHWDLIEQWIAQVSPEELENHPDLIARRGAVALMLGNLEPGKVDLERAEQALRERDDRENLARTLVWQAGAHRFLGNYKKGLEKAREALSLVKGHQDWGTIQAETEREIGLAWYRLGNMNEALSSMEKALTRYEEEENEENIAQVNLDLGLTSMQLGTFEQAALYLETARRSLENRDNVLQLGSVHNNLGVLESNRGAYQTAHDHFQQALTYASRSAYGRLKGFTYASLGDLFAEIELFSVAHTEYQKSRKIARKIEENYLKTYLDLAEVRLARKRGDRKEARNILNRLEGRILTKESSSEAGLWHFETGLIALEEEHYRSARDHLSRAQRIFQGNFQYIEDAKARLSKAYAAYKQDLWKESLQGLTETFQVVEELDSLHPLVIVGREMEDFLREVQNRSNHLRQIQSLLRKIRNFQSNLDAVQRMLLTNVQPGTNKPPLIDIQAFGKPLVRVDGEVLEKPEWANQKAVRELFFFLLTNRSGFSKEEVGSAMWPNSTSEQLKQQFKNAVYRLRRALEKKAVLYSQLNRTYRFNWDVDYRYDVEEFQEYIRYAKEAGNTQEKIQHLKIAVEQYDHPYLPHVDGVWVEPIRHQLYLAYEGAVISLVELMLQHGQYRKAISYGERLYEVNPCQETACRLTMRAYSSVGDRAGVARQYHRCKEALWEELEALPSPETKELYQSLIR
jgi:ATP/maltotriose-dependent transcriptional regulator MalT/DNA-binding SARP family transcriptional activator